MTRFYADENFPLPVVEFLRDLGHDVLTVREAGKANLGISDELVLAFAVEMDRVVLTGNRQDYMKLHRLQPNHAGIVVCTEDPNFDSLARRIHQAISGEDSLKGKLIRVNRPQE
jgi:predicted nuclease of predicted toxin-antitoxin system